MSQTTKLGIGPLVSARAGSVSLPTEITLACPFCGEEAADKGQCLVEMAMVADPESKTGFRAKLLSDCRSCSRQGEAAIVVQTPNSS